MRSGEQTVRVLELRRRGGAPRAEGARVTLTWKRDEVLVYPV